MYERLFILGWRTGSFVTKLGLTYILKILVLQYRVLSDVTRCYYEHKLAHVQCLVAANRGFHSSPYTSYLVAEYYVLEL